MKSQEKYLQELKQWLHDTFAELLPFKCREILDLGCGTGLELDHIWQKDPAIEVIGVDFFGRLHCLL